MSLLPKEIKTEAVLVLEDKDTTEIMGTAGGNAIDPPWDTKAMDLIMVEIPESAVLELDEDWLGDSLEIDEEYEVSVVRKGNKIRIYFGIIGSKVLHHTGATYEHSSLTGKH